MNKISCEFEVGSMKNEQPFPFDNTYNLLGDANKNPERH